MKSEISEIKSYKLEYKCSDESCEKNHVEITIKNEKDLESKFKFDWETLDKLVGDLVHMNNINHMKKYSEDLKNLVVDNEVDDILKSWE